MENNSGVPSLAGWHDDPEDPNFIRYSNGRSWTGERVAKDRTLTLKNNAVYRPGGSDFVPEEKEPEPEAAKEPAAYQPLTRRERRQLEISSAPEPEPTERFEEEFEFQSATPAARHYAPGNAALKAAEPTPPVVVEEAEKEMALFDGFEEAFPQGKQTHAPIVASEEEDDQDASSLPPLLEPLPSLDVSEFVAAPVARREPVIVAESPEDETFTLPVLGASTETTSLPSLDFGGDSEPTKKDDEEDAVEEEDFFVGSSSVVKEDVEEDESEDNVDEDFGFSPVASTPAPRLSYEAPPAVKRHSYEPPVVEAPVEEKKEEASVVAPKVEVQPEATVAAPEPSEAKSDDTEALPAFGFKSKLARPVEEEAIRDEKGAEAAPKPQPVTAPKADVATVNKVEDDEGDDDDEVEVAKSPVSRLKSLFGRNSSKEVLDYDYQNNDEKDEDEEVDEATPTKAVVAPAKAPEPVAKEKTDDKGDDDEDDDADEETPKLRAGLFSSRQEKEDAAVEVELVGRLNDLARRVSALQKEEQEVLERVEQAKAKEAELNSLILKAHEEHELLDQLAKDRRKDMDRQDDAKEDDQFMNLLESHEASGQDEKPSEETVALPVVKDKEEDSDDRLPELKLS